MSKATKHALSKVPEVTLLFWIMKIVATTLGETGGDSVSMSMNLGHLEATIIFAAIFVIAVIAQIKAKAFHPFLYWATIISTTTVGTTLADFADRSLGIGYAGGTSLLFALLMASLAIWYKTLGSVSVDTISAPKAEMFANTWSSHLDQGAANRPGKFSNSHLSAASRFCRSDALRINPGHL